MNRQQVRLVSASAAERVRFALELHDCFVPSLTSVELQVDVLRRQAEANRPIGAELGRIQRLLREEVLKLRELMQQMKATDVDAQRLLAVLRDTVERFQRETGINARFVTDLDELDMPQRLCRELLLIVQESLMNVRKHSGARHAEVRLASDGQNWSLTLEDDGKGFPFEGRYNQQQMEEAGKGPMIIKERVRLIAGELTVESNPGHGTRLEITVPRNAVNVDAQGLLAELRDTVERFQRETGINARFVTDLELNVPQLMRRELLPIIQEGLANVRKHSGARHAEVRLASAGQVWNLTVEDDGN